MKSTRRSFISGLASAPLLGASPADVSPSAGEPHGQPIHQLNLPPEVLADIEKFAEPIIRDARLLDEVDLGDLPAGALPPGFVFIPR